MYVIIVNEKAGNRRARRVWEGLKKELLKYEIPFILYKSKTAEAAATFLNEQLTNKKIQGVIAVGGDGTTNSVIQIVANKKFQSLFSL